MKNEYVLFVRKAGGSGNHGCRHQPRRRTLQKPDRKIEGTGSVSPEREIKKIEKDKQIDPGQNM